MEGNNKSHMRCKLCYDSFSAKHVERVPRTLECLHCFCTSCIQKLKNLQGHAIECPLCFVVTILPLKGVDHLTANQDIIKQLTVRRTFQKCKTCSATTYPPRTATLHCVDCQQVYCGVCSDKVHVQEENLDHVIRLANSVDDKNSIVSAKNGKKTSSSALEEKPSSKPSNFVCSDHQQILSLYCQADKVRCCVQCRLSPQHQAHDCDFLHKSNDDSERNALVAWHLQLEQLIDKRSKDRLTVQRTMEELKKNTKSTKDNIRKTFRELRTLLNDVEAAINHETESVSQNKMNQLQNQCSSMIESTNKAKTLSCLCQRASDMDYFESLVEKKKLERDVVRTIEEELVGYYGPCESSDLFIQFPNREGVTSAILNLPYIVRAPPAPVNFTCQLEPESCKVRLSWSSPRNMKFIYPITLFAVYASVGEKDSFRLLKKITGLSLSLDVTSEEFAGKQMVQFQVSSINVVGQSNPCFPKCIRMLIAR